NVANVAKSFCLGGFLGPPSGGATVPLDSVTTHVTAKELYDGTQDGPLFLTVHTRMDFRSDRPPSLWGACQAATDVVFVIERPLNPGNHLWSDGLAFQARSSDSATVRRRNSVESFRVDPFRQRIEHDSWEYTGYEASLEPSDGLAACNGPGACSPTFWSEAV